MRLALLGLDEDLLQIATASARDSANLRGPIQIVACAAQDTQPHLLAALQEHFPHIRLLANWEDLLADGDWQGVLVGRAAHTDVRGEQLRKLAQCAVPTLFVQPPDDSMLLLYELDMIRRDSQAVLLPYLPARLHPAIRQLAEQLQSATSPNTGGKIGLVTFERNLRNCGREHVLRQFAIDVDLLRALCGELNQLNAVTAFSDEHDYENLAVQLSGSNAISARYHVLPVAGAALELGKLVISIAGNRLELSMPASPHQPWTLTDVGRAQTQSFPEWQPAMVACENFHRACGGERVVPDLLDAARAVELAATIPRSLQRRRTIELHFEDHTEENTFKGTMAAGGCLLLMIAPVVLLVVALLDKAGVPFVGAWPWVLAFVFGGFTLLQLLVWVSKRPR